MTTYRFLLTVATCSLLCVLVASFCPPPDKKLYSSYGPPKTRYPVGDYVTYKCATGYLLVGSRTRRCKPDYTWTSFAPRCHRLLIPILGCRRPDDPSHGSVHSVPAHKTAYRIGDYVTYSCGTGYCLHGDADVYCRATGWHNPPTCRPCVCRRPSNPSYGSIHSVPPHKTTYRIGDYVTYSCDTGYCLHGDADVYCRATGWHNPPTCRPCGCSRPSDPPYGSIQSHPARKSHFSPNEWVLYRCDRGYCIDSNPRVYCRGNSWSHTPVCSYCCSRPSDPPHGSIHSRPTNKRYFAVNDRVTYRCDDDYYLNGDPSAICRRSGWSHTPTCIRRCIRPADPPSGRVHSDPPHKRIFDLDEWVIYRCNEGYCLDGDSSVYCRDHGWTEPPVCRRCCYRPSDPEYGSVHSDPPRKNYFAIDEWVIYRCEEGYYLNGDSSVYCRARGWSHTPTCRRGCVHRDAPTNGSYVPEGKTSWYPDEVATYSCDDHYCLHGYKNTSCRGESYDYSWDYDVPTCHRCCVRPPNPPYGYIQSYPNTKQKFAVGDHINYRCRVGYHLDGRSRVTCRYGGWSHTPTCRRTCPHRNPPTYGSYVNDPIPSVWYNGDVAIYACNTHYRLVGYARSRCRSNGSWQYRVPTCIRIIIRPPSCQHHCGEYLSSAGCSCNFSCRGHYNCCHDYDEYCRPRIFPVG